MLEGLADGRVALLTKSHHVLVDGIETVDLGQVLLDTRRGAQELGGRRVAGPARPSPFSLMAGRSGTPPPTPTPPWTPCGPRPARCCAVPPRRRTTGRVIDALTNRTPRAESPIIGPLSQQRRLVTVHTELADYRRVRDAHGGTINDVVLATVAGGLRAG